MILKFFRSLSAPLLLVLAIGLWGNSGMQAAKTYPLPAYLDGSMMPYDLTVNQPLTEVVPDSLTPVFVNYLGRHGARFLSSSKKVTKIRKVLEKAEKSGELSGHGKKFLKLLSRVERLTAGRWGALDSIGTMEQQELAVQMHSLFPDLLSKGRVKAEATYVPRVVMSMYDFCHELGILSPGLQIYTSAGKQNDMQLRFFDTNLIYSRFLAKGKWREVVASFETATVPEAPAARLFRKGHLPDNTDLRKLTLDMYGVLQSLRATAMGTPTSFWMTEEEYASCWRVDNLDHFLRRTASTLSAEPGIAARPLLESFIAYGDSAANSASDLKAMLRFGHAETLMPLLSLMDVEGCASRSSLYSDIWKVWKDYEVVPLGANLLVAMLRAPSGRMYAAMRLNGHWVSPMNDGSMVAEWSSLKEYWQENLGELLRIERPNKKQMKWNYKPELRLDPESRNRIISGPSPRVATGDSTQGKP